MEIIKQINEVELNNNEKITMINLITTFYLFLYNNKLLFILN